MIARRWPRNCAARATAGPSVNPRIAKYTPAYLGAIQALQSRCAVTGRAIIQQVKKKGAVNDLNPKHQSGAAAAHETQRKIMFEAGKIDRRSQSCSSTRPRSTPRGRRTAQAPRRLQGSVRAVRVGAAD